MVKGEAAAVPQLGYSLLVFFRVFERHKRQVLHDHGISRYSEEEEKFKGDETHPELLNHPREDPRTLRSS